MNDEFVGITELTFKLKGSDGSEFVVTAFGVVSLMPGTPVSNGYNVIRKDQISCFVGICCDGCTFEYNANKGTYIYRYPDHLENETVYNVIIAFLSKNSYRIEPIPEQYRAALGVNTVSRSGLKRTLH